MAHALDGQEYKLLLAPDALDGATATKKAKGVWKALKRIIDDSLGPKHDGGPRHDGSFAHKDRRSVRFYDKVPLLLDGQGFAYRERFALDDDDRESGREVTLKLRRPEAERGRVAAADLTGVQAAARTKLEEDIGPEIIRKGATVALAEPPGTRTLFALSTTQSAPDGGTIATARDIVDLYPALLEVMRATAADRLQAGPAIREIVLKGASVDLGDSKGAFAFTLWRFAPAAGRPDIAEVSFRCAAKHGIMPAQEADRARALFIAMQQGLRDQVYAGGASKTALALPR